MKKVLNPFTNPTANNWDIYKGSDNNYYTTVGHDKYIAIHECQVFNDFGDVSYVFIFGDKAK